MCTVRVIRVEEYDVNKNKPCFHLRDGSKKELRSVLASRYHKFRTLDFREPSVLGVYLTSDILRTSKRPPSVVTRHEVRVADNWYEPRVLRPGSCRKREDQSGAGHNRIPWRTLTSVPVNEKSLALTSKPLTKTGMDITVIRHTLHHQEPNTRGTDHKRRLKYDDIS